MFRCMDTSSNGNQTADMSVLRGRLPWLSVYWCMLIYLCIQDSTGKVINIAPLATLRSSSTVGSKYKQSYAIDEKLPMKNTNIDTCHCCFSSNEEKSPFLEAKFDRPYVIHRIKVAGRLYNNQVFNDLSGVAVLIDGIKATANWNSEANTITVDSIEGPVQTVKIQKEYNSTIMMKYSYLAVCELEAYVTATNIANYATLEATSPWDSYTKDLAVDTITSHYDDACHCCFISQNRSKPFFKAILPGSFDIASIVVEGRRPSRSGSTLHGLEVYLNTTKVNVKENTLNNSVYVSPINAVQTIKVEQSNMFLYICEISIFVPECIGGYYGSQCDVPCGHCSKNGTCNIVTGRCSDGCMAGYKGELCKQPCLDGKFGQKCGFNCNCFDNDVCNKTTGFCPNGCSAGWTGRNCSEACLDGQFGQKCGFNCNCFDNEVCNKTTGFCPNGCSAGWTGRNCSEACLDRKFGPNCTNDCHCNYADVCNKTTGYCENGCASRWMGDNCSTECKNNTFGKDCISTCNCINGSPCDERNGTCDLKQCSPGWLGDACNIECPLGTFGFKCIHVCGSCKENTTCDHVSGVCHSGCATNYAGSVCTEYIPEKCEHNRFGADCKFTCHCINDSPCDNIDGTCYLGECFPGWFGDSCDKTCEPGTFGSNCKLRCGSCKDNNTCDHILGVCSKGCDTKYTGPGCTEYITESKVNKSVLGVTFGITGVIIICLSVVIVILFVRRRKPKPRKTFEADETYEKPNMYITPTESSAYSTIQSGNNFEMTTTDPV